VGQNGIRFFCSGPTGKGAARTQEIPGRRRSSRSLGRWFRCRWMWSLGLAHTDDLRGFPSSYSRETKHHGLGKGLLLGGGIPLHKRSLRSWSDTPPRHGAPSVGFQATRAINAVGGNCTNSISCNAGPARCRHKTTAIHQCSVRRCRPRNRHEP